MTRRFRLGSMLTQALKLDSAAFAPSRFALHGRAEVAAQGRALRIEAAGPFNLEFVQAVCRMLDVAAHALPADRRFVECVALRHSLLMPPAAFELLRNFSARSQRVGYRPQAMLLVVPAQTEGRDLLLPRLVKLWSPSRPVHVFEASAEAELMLSRLLRSWH